MGLCPYCLAPGLTAWANLCRAYGAKRLLLVCSKKRARERANLCRAYGAKRLLLVCSKEEGKGK